MKRWSCGKIAGSRIKTIAFHHWDKQYPTDNVVVVVVNMANQNRERYVIGFPRAGCGRLDLTVTHITTALILQIIQPLMSRLRRK
ncbi:MAG: hypothetical protein E3K38_02105 [Candidatus Kuenenia stuttgartiensis]|nr:hypothetical protein [Candidatus Kuenenia stuttgartiensis]